MQATPRGRNVKRATYDLIVIGSGPAGEKGAAKAAYFGKKVALVEQAQNYGGAVANTGVPTKAMRETALYLSGFQKRDLHGLNLAYDGTLTIDRFMHRGRTVRQALDQWIGANLERHRVDVHHGRAAFADAYTVRVEGEREPKLLEAGVILIATGSKPRRPPTFPFAAPGVYDSDTIQHMERLPRSLAIAGGGTIGCEYGCLFKVLGLDEVRVVHTGERILPFADHEISTMMREVMESHGVEFHMSDRVERVDATPALALELRSGKRLEPEALLVALGRRSNVAALKLENAGVRLDEQGQLLVNEHFQTNVPHIYAARRHRRTRPGLDRDGGGARGDGPRLPFRRPLPSERHHRRCRAHVKRRPFPADRDLDDSGDLDGGRDRAGPPRKGCGAHGWALAVRR